MAALSNERGKKAIICGQMGSDLKMLPLLIGLGIRHISVNWSQVPLLKREIQNLNYLNCRELAKEALLCKSVDEVDSVLAKFSNIFH